MSLLLPPTIPPTEGRRIALLRVAPELWLGLLYALGERRITQRGLPLDAQLVATDYDFHDRCIVLTLEHESFELVISGAYAPYLNVVFTDHGPWEVPESA